MKLHLGCGARYIPGFIHVDIADYPYIDYKSDVNDLSFIETESVSYIYASHVLEYFDKFQVHHVLKEWGRVLKSKGLLRIAVPDFGALAELYSNDNRFMPFISGVLYGFMDGFYHKACYDFESLTELLLYHRFKDVKKWDWREVPLTQRPEDDWSRSYVPHMDFNNGKLISLNVQAVK